MTGPLKGLRVIELAAMGPVPFTGMLLADMGAEVIRVDRTVDTDLGIAHETSAELRGRNKRSVAIDLKSPEGRGLFLELVGKADVVLEGWRPGVADRLGIGYDACRAVQRKIIYGKATGWGSDGPLALTAGHDINYIALTGALSMIGEAGHAPVPPLNLVGDYGGGAMYLAFGLLAAHYEAQRSGEGQIVDAAMVDGVTSLLTVFYGFQAAGKLNPERGGNILDGGAPYYTTYQTLDGGWLAVGCIEARFYVEFLKGLRLDPQSLPAQNDRSQWLTLRQRFADIIATKTRANWEVVFDGTDACVTPVLSLSEAASHPHNVARGATQMFNGVAHPAPAPRFSRSLGELVLSPPSEGEQSRAVLQDWGIDDTQIADALAKGIVKQQV
ncbi:CaiB/BaiF CoA transferase family protein [Brucella haematophila]|uniref:CaiB/BaiF CoA transferase family protein n=1 Tax=Brucella haematophila TaxID=419474 RepID=UPI001AEEC51C|nr:CaiB/BaiF CoA-transferase family protein [Brucella haematophila]